MFRVFGYYINLKGWCNMKNKIISTLVVFTGFCSLFLTWDHYRLAAFPTISKDSLPFIEEAEGLRVAAIPYTAEESKQFLKRDLLSRGYRPVQITIENNSPKTFHLTMGDLARKQASGSEIAGKIMRGAIPRAIGYKIASLIFWPFAIPSTIDGIRSIHTYNTLKKDFNAKQFKEELVLPYSTQHRVLYLKEAASKEPIDLVLKDQETGDDTHYRMTVS